MKRKMGWFERYVLFFIAIVVAFVFGFYTSTLLWSINLFPFNPQSVYYEMPAGGYIYEDDYPLEYGGKCIRYNKYSYNGTLDYQITLNPMETK